MYPYDSTSVLAALAAHGAAAVFVESSIGPKGDVLAIVYFQKLAASP
jgi:hypothetical protein